MSNRKAAPGPGSLPVSASKSSQPQINVALKLTGDFLPEDVTRAVGLRPTQTWRAGDRVQETELRHKGDGWVFALPYREAYDMNKLLSQLLDALGPYVGGIAEAVKKFRLRNEISFGVYIGEETPTCWFAVGTMQRVTELGADLDVDLILTK